MLNERSHNFSNTKGLLAISNVYTNFWVGKLINIEVLVET